MLMLTDSLEWWARRFQRARAAPSEARPAGGRGGDRRRYGPRREDGRFERDDAPRAGRRFTRGALEKR
jgi:hypothetical protein